MKNHDVDLMLKYPLASRWQELGIQLRDYMISKKVVFADVIDGNESELKLNQALFDCVHEFKRMSPNKKNGAGALMNDPISVVEEKYLRDALVYLPTIVHLFNHSNVQWGSEKHNTVALLLLKYFRVDFFNLRLKGWPFKPNVHKTIRSFVEANFINNMTKAKEATTQERLLTELLSRVKKLEAEVSSYKLSATEAQKELAEVIQENNILKDSSEVIEKLYKEKIEQEEAAAKKKEERENAPFYKRGYYHVRENYEHIDGGTDKKFSNIYKDPETFFHTSSDLKGNCEQNAGEVFSGIGSIIHAAVDVVIDLGILVTKVVQFAIVFPINTVSLTLNQFLRAQEHIHECAEEARARRRSRKQSKRDPKSGPQTEPKAA